MLLSGAIPLQIFPFLPQLSLFSTRNRLQLKALLFKALKSASYGVRARGARACICVCTCCAHLCGVVEKGAFVRCFSDSDPVLNATYLRLPHHLRLPALPPPPQSSPAPARSRQETRIFHRPRGHQVLRLQGTTSNLILRGKVQTVPQPRSPTSHALPSSPSPPRTPTASPTPVNHPEAEPPNYLHTAARPPQLLTHSKRKQDYVVWLLFLISHLTSRSKHPCSYPALSHWECRSLHYEWPSSILFSPSHFPSGCLDMHAPSSGGVLRNPNITQALTANSTGNSVIYYPLGKQLSTPSSEPCKPKLVGVN